MDSETEHTREFWKFCSDVEGREAETRLADDVQILLRKGWTPEENTGIAKKFAFSSVASALVRCPSVRL